MLCLFHFYLSRHCFPLLLIYFLVCGVPVVAGLLQYLIWFSSPFELCVWSQVVRDKRTGKTKGYGFVSFSNPLDLAAALKEMNGTYS